MQHRVICLGREKAGTVSKQIIISCQTGIMAVRKIFPYPRSNKVILIILFFLEFNIINSSNQCQQNFLSFPLGKRIEFYSKTIFDFRSLLPEGERIRCDRCGSWRTWREKKELVSRNVRKEDATFAKEKLVEICTNMEIDI